MQKYLFKASAVALRGSARKPYYQDLGEHAVVSSYAGSAGRAQSRNEGFVLGRDITYGAAHSELTAGNQNGTYRTVIQTTLEKFTVRDGWLTADAIISRLVSVYDARTYPGRKISRILPAGSRWVNMKVNGKPIVRDLPPACTLSEQQQEEFFAGKHDNDPKYQPGFIPQSEYIQDFGTIFMCEWAWIHPQEHHDQSLTMVRLALGSDFGADLDCCSTRTDGSGWPP